MTAEEKNEASHKTEVWTRIIGSIVGALILALQGVNLSETNGQTTYIQRIDVALNQQKSLIEEVSKESVRLDKALENQRQMVESMETVLQNQTIALDLLKTEKK